MAQNSYYFMTKKSYFSSLPIPNSVQNSFRSQGSGVGLQASRQERQFGNNNNNNNNFGGNNNNNNQNGNHDKTIK